MAEAFKHQIPLVLFTTLLPIAIGLEIAAFLMGLSPSPSKTIVLQALILSLVCTLLSAFFVFFHLGHKWRGARALKGFTHSPLSREIILSAFFGFLLLVAIFYLDRIGFSNLMAGMMGLNGAIGLAAALSIGPVYNLPRQITWRGGLNSMGPSLGALLMAASYAGYYLRALDSYPWIFYAIVLLLFTESIGLIKRVKLYNQVGKSSHQLTFVNLRNLVRFSHLVKGILLLTLFLLAINKISQAFFYLVGIMILVDRFAFYASAAQQTPEATVGLLKDERMRAALQD